jgi:OOP family OmpA-OmpF porin
MAGITYKFGHKKIASEAPVAMPEPIEPVVETKVEQAPVPATAAVEKKPEPKPQPKPAAPKIAAKTTQNVFFELGKADISANEAQKINEVAEWAKQNSDATITLTGYADAETGNAELNKKLSERRAAAVKDALVKKGVSASRITTDAKGDTVQPFSANDKNRAVIIIGQGK